MVYNQCSQYLVNKHISVQNLAEHLPDETIRPRHGTKSQVASNHPDQVREGLWRSLQNLRDDWFSAQRGTAVSAPGSMKQSPLIRFARFNAGGIGKDLDYLSLVGHYKGRCCLIYRHYQSPSVYSRTSLLRLPLPPSAPLLLPRPLLRMLSLPYHCQ